VSRHDSDKLERIKEEEQSENVKTKFGYLKHILNY
jgi:hypothetical protein